MSPSQARLLALRAALLLALLALALLLVRGGGAATLGARLVQAVRGLGWLAAPLYALAYLPGALLMLPATPFTAGAGYLFGWAGGVLVGAPASAAGAALTLRVGRSLARPLARRLARALPRFEPIAAAVERRGFEVVVLLRMTPLIPFPILNYVLGLTRLPARRFALASLLGMLPGNVLYAYLGSRAPRLAEAFSRPELPGAAGLAVAGGVVAFTVLVVWLAGRRLARDLREAEVPPPDAQGASRGPRPQQAAGSWDVL